ncbi:3-ketoacyl-(acyl-carrier-protein) reductase [marine gamma proteobacterium HTCC2143]|jgi:3-oxoacyl-[acyl-carrier protein] reductase|uniref:3-oxoacyl-[acyl-carrier-protein] reductase n=1 Tax=marine gamma proteobacterium HTCC2143 TaxID=247633 RepID=A0YGQ4_9GAMM|nr:3-ketoacyl-(acyl-carrier-protein) reductase [marine gamma proteobacterium HTCC2143]
MTDKIALVTGASRGIGQAIALQLGKDGFTVIGTSTTQSGAASITEYLGDAGIGGEGMVLNVTSSVSVTAVIKTISEKYAAPLVLVNNAGITKDNILMRMKEDEWNDVVNTNLSSIFRLSKSCVRGMTKAKWGRIISISSVVGAMGNAGQSNYAATKAGMEGFSRSLAKELGSRNITINCVAPGFIDTDMTKELSEDNKNMMLAKIPLSRLGEPEEVAAVVAFLAGDGGAYVTGETIHVNGGMYVS